MLPDEVPDFPPATQSQSSFFLADQLIVGTNESQLFGRTAFGFSVGSTVAITAQVGNKL